MYIIYIYIYIISKLYELYMHMLCYKIWDTYYIIKQKTAVNLEKNLTPNLY